MTILSKDYHTDGKSIFCNGKAIPNADPKTFTIPKDSHYFAYDKNQVYALSGAKEGLQIWTDVDIESIEFFPNEMKYIDKDGNDNYIQSSAYFADNNHLFYFNWHFIEFENPHHHQLLKAELQRRKPQANAWWNWTDEYYNSLKHISKFIYTDGKKVFFYFNKEDGKQILKYPFNFGLEYHISYYSLIPNIDINFLEILNEYYVKDNTAVYYISRKIDADYATFEVINQHFAKDKNGIWYNGYYVDEELDLATFEIIKMEKDEGFHFSFAKDKNAIFSTQNGGRIGKYKGYSNLLLKLKNSDTNSFKIISNIWAKDKNNVYCYGKIWNVIDAGTFEFLFTGINGNTSYAKDKNNLYDANGRRVIKGIDGKSFVMLNKYWGKDKNVVFNFETERILKSIDAESFIVTDDKGGAEDKNYKFMPTHNEKDLGYNELKKIKKK